MRHDGDGADGSHKDARYLGSPEQQRAVDSGERILMALDPAAFDHH